MAEDIRIDAYGAGTIGRGPLLRRTAWGAIFAGTFVAIACQMLLVLLGVAIGAATINPTTEADPAAGVGIFAGIWWLVTSIASLFVGGLVTAWLAGFPRWVDGMLHGLVVWALTMALSAWLVSTSAGALLGGAMSTLQSAMQSPATENLTEESTINRLQQRAQSMLGGGSQQLDPQSRQIIQRHIPDPSAATPDQRQAAASELVSTQGLDQQAAQSKVQAYVNSGGQGTVLGSPESPTPGEAREAGKKVADAVTNAAVWTFFAILLGLGAAAFGGAIGRPQNLGDDDRARRVIA
jgi:hypothetical protein